MFIRQNRSKIVIKEAELIRLIKEIIAERLSNYTYIPQGMNNVLTKKEKSRIEKLDFLSELDTKFGIEEDADISKKQLEDKIINEDDFIFGEDNLSSENNISVNDKNENNDNSYSRKTNRVKK